MLLWIVTFSLIGSVGAAAGAALLLVFPQTIRDALVPALVSYAAGVLLGAAFLGMIPTALARGEATLILPTVLAGLVLFFVLEKLVLWRHCHDRGCQSHHGQTGPLILIGDAFHNFVDGVVIAAAFLVAVPLGIATAVAVIAHEVPQEVGDFAILLDNGYGRAQAFWLNTLSASTTLPGALAGYFWLAQMQEAIAYILALSAASFVYIALADLVPSLHQKTTASQSILQLVLLLTGIGTIAWMHHAR
uniref:ZIP family metal transporter n=1 Tax=Rhodoferax sp. TaxID=50421 RepID=UPI00272C1C19|nr:ZIP family metal transporter [Rhodoferax sp.]